MIGYDALRAEQAAARAEGRLLGIGLGLYVEPSGIAMGNMASEGAIVSDRRQRPGAGADEQRQPRPEPGDDDRPGRRRPARRRRRRRHRHPGRHRVGAVRPGHRRQPQRRHPQRRRRRGRRRGARQGARDRRPPCSRRRPRTSRSTDGRISVRGTPAQGDVDHRGRPHRLPQPGRRCRRAWRWGSRRRPATRRTPRSRGRTRATPASCEVDPRTGEVDDAALRRQRGLRRDDQPDVVEGQIAGGVVQGIGGVLYEHMVYDDDGNPLSDDVRRLPAADRGRGADHRVRPHRDAGADQPRRLQGDGRGRRHRLAAGGHQRRRRRRRPPRRPPDRASR